jgi:hypothetical protein
MCSGTGGGKQTCRTCACTGHTEKLCSCGGRYTRRHQAPGTRPQGLVLPGA